MHPLTLIMYSEPPFCRHSSVYFCPSNIEFVADVKVDFPSLVNLELKVKIDQLSASLVVKILGLTRVHVKACTHKLRSNSPFLSADLRGAHCLICPYHSSIVDEALGHRLNVII